MKTLKNGATVMTIDSTKRLVLAETDRDYVTWRMDQEGNCFWGHYFPRRGDDNDALTDAISDYNKRYNEMGV